MGDKYDENATLLRELKGGDAYLTKGNTESVYLKSLGEDRHLIKDVKGGSEYVVPHGRFSVFKKIV